MKTCLKVYYGNHFDQIWKKNLGIGGHFGFMQIKTLKSSRMGPCANYAFLEITF